MNRLRKKVLGQQAMNGNLYKPLRKQHLEIRLLKILVPNKLDSVLNCTLEIVHLDRAPKYKALSYAWGNPSMTAEILVNEHPFQTTLNLKAALQNFRDTIPGIRLWVDAICVNQNDLAERGHQVQLMKSIYSRAEEKYVWLGIQSNDSDKAIDFMELLAARYRDCIARAPVGGKAEFGTFESTVSWDVVKSFAALERLLVRPW